MSNFFKIYVNDWNTCAHILKQWWKKKKKTFIIKLYPILYFMKLKIDENLTQFLSVFFLLLLLLFYNFPMDRTHSFIPLLALHTSFQYNTLMLEYLCKSVRQLVHNDEKNKNMNVLASGLVCDLMIIMCEIRMSLFA